MGIDLGAGSLKTMIVALDGRVGIQSRYFARGEQRRAHAVIRRISQQAFLGGTLEALGFHHVYAVVTPMT